MDRRPDDTQADRRSYQVEVAGVGGPRNRTGHTALLALAAVVVLVGSGIVSGQLFPVNRGAVPASLAEATAPAEAVVAVTASPDLAVAPVASPRLTLRVRTSPVDVVALVAATPRHGTGSLVFVDGRLHTTRRACGSKAPLSSCLTVRIDGLRGVSVVPDDAMGTWPGDPKRGETLVLLPRDGHLVFLGSLVVDPAGIPTADDLFAREAAQPSAFTPPPSLFEADGVLIDHAGGCGPGASCGGPVATLVPSALIAGAQADQQTATPVGIPPGALGISPGEGAWTIGPFLLRRSPANAPLPWQVVAREDQGSILHVVIP